jgi:2,3-bisphosphoglycerate-independent phosphoglycerate mutase
MKKPNMILIMDGFGLNPNPHGNAIAKAKKPNLDRIMSQYPHTTLQASGPSVGLPVGQMGNSEVGHLNIGGGRIVYQDYTLISSEITNGRFQKNGPLNQVIDYVIQNKTALHILGLISDGGVHSHLDHLFALLDLAKSNDVSQVYIHGILDGRDVPPRSAITYIEQLEKYMKKIDLGRIVTVSGRYYAMDRDKRWERLVKAYDAMTLGDGEHAGTAIEAVKASYQRNENDEFVIPTTIGPVVPIKNKDGIIMFNFRPDRAREITRAFVDPDFKGFHRKKVIKELCYVCMTEYDEQMPNVLVAFEQDTIQKTLGQVLASHHLTQLRIAETEKYAHVTFFFNGGVEIPNPGEDRILIPSPKVATYDMQPEMSANLVTAQVIKQIQREYYDVIILNFANADMVGHTGVIPAAVIAIETLEECVPQIVKEVLKRDGQILLTADHGNADYMLDDNDNVVTAHSLNPVPLVHISNHSVQLKSGGKLADIAPTLLELMNIEIPKEMTGISLIQK